MTTFWGVISSPVGPAVVLLIGAFVQVIIGRWVRRPGVLTGLALFFVGLATWFYLGLQAAPVVPTYSQPWQLMLQAGFNLLWIGDGWNWYISGLLLLLGGVGILLTLNSPQPTAPIASERRVHATLAVHLGVLAAGLLFVGSGNLLTATLTWVVLDVLILLRSAVQTEHSRAAFQLAPQNQAKGLSLIGAMFLLIGLLPAGPSGPGQPLQGGILPLETIALMLLAGAIRAGVYPFHLWLLPSDQKRVNVSERLLDHMVPVLCGLWLLGWTIELGGQLVLLRPDVLALMILAILGSALAAWTSQDQPNHTTFVLITSVGVAALSSALAHTPGPRGLIWPTTAFALGGALWLVGEQAWETWGWQIPVSVGALALAGVPFTPGFLGQPALARLLTAGSFFVIFFLIYVAAQSIQIAALLRSWGAPRANHNSLQPGVVVSLLVASIALGLPLAIAGFLPRMLASLANLTDAIPPLLGNPPNVVAEGPVWIALVTPLLMGITLVMLRPYYWHLLGAWPQQINRVTRLEWL
ncbi:MAG: hypothetical protein HC802_16550, partial [Caldilineaceae bacterium]|nr:hypothetical protein [Caldilineaceae bacterium]